MSKIGEKAIPVPASVHVEIQDSTILVKGSKGELSITLPLGIAVSRQQDALLLGRVTHDKSKKSKHGLFRSLVANAVAGVEKGWEKRLEVVGTGFNVKLQGQDLIFKVGFSHPVVYKSIDGIQFRVEGNNKVTVSGVDKQLVGQVAYQIKMIRKPDIYKGKGIRYEGGYIKTKVGKKAKA